MQRDEYIKEIKYYLAGISTTLSSLPLDEIAQTVRILEKARLECRQVLIFGNGGSAATASHFVCDLAKGAIVSDKPRFRAISLTDNIPLISAWANDTTYENVFAEQLTNLVQAGDIAIAISGSGNSVNVLKAVEAAKVAQAITIGFTGFDGGKLKDMVDLCIVVPNHCMEQVEDVHLILEHMIKNCLYSADERS